MTVIRARKSCPYGYKSRITKMIKFKELKRHKMNIHMFIMNIINNLINSNHVQTAHNKQKSRQNGKKTLLKHALKSP